MASFGLATKAGVNKVRSVSRIPEEYRWSEDCTDWVKHVPWHLYNGHPETDGEIPEEKIVETRTEAVRPVDTESLHVVVRTGEARRYMGTRGCVLGAPIGSAAWVGSSTLAMSCEVRMS